MLNRRDTNNFYWQGRLIQVRLKPELQTVMMLKDQKLKFCDLY